MEYFKNLGWGKYYKTLNPLTLLARYIAKRYYKDNPEKFRINEPFINSPIGFQGIHRHMLGIPLNSPLIENSFLYTLFYSFLKPIFDFKKRLKYMFVHKMHKMTILNIPSHTWTDADERMFHACFTILGEFVEKELGKESWFPDKEDSMYKGYRLHFVGDANPKAIDLWLWYKEELPKETKEYEEYLDKKYKHGFKTSPISELTTIVKTEQDEIDDKKYGWAYSRDYIEDLKDKKLMELMKIRQQLWT